MSDTTSPRVVTGFVDFRTGLPVRRPLQRGTKPLQRRKNLPARSPKREAEYRLYRPEVAAFLAEHEWCEFPLGCGQPSTSVQHTRGRFGWRLRVKAWWRASCATHQDFAETRTGEALACGWLVRVGSVEDGGDAA